MLMVVPKSPQGTPKELPKGAPETAKALTNPCEDVKRRFHGNVVLLKGNGGFWPSEAQVGERKTTRDAQRERPDEIKEEKWRRGREKGSPKWPEGDRAEVGGR